MNYIITKTVPWLQHVVKKESTKLHAVAMWHQIGIMKFIKIGENEHHE